MVFLESFVVRVLKQDYRFEHVCGTALEPINMCIINVLYLYLVITHEEVAFTGARVQTALL